VIAYAPIVARAPREPASPSAVVPALLRYVAARGHASGELAARLDFPPDAADRDELVVPPRAIAERFDAAAELLGEPHLGLRVAGALPLRRYDVVELALRAGPTLRDALATAARHATVVHPALACELVDDAGAGEARWIQRTPAHPRGLGRHLDAYGLAVVLGHARAGLAEPWLVTRAWFAHARPRTLEPLQRMFGTDELVFGASDSGFAFARAHLDAPIHGDPRLLATVAALAAAQPPAQSGLLAPRVAEHLRGHLADSAADVAHALHVSARTLQRRLETEGTTFSALVDTTREALARELLGDPARSLVEIAERVGFSDLATFSRAFKRWTGKPPGLFRRS
jgi:AraC-like DNA-binding protein